MQAGLETSSNTITHHLQSLWFVSSTTSLIPTSGSPSITSVMSDNNPLIFQGVDTQIEIPSSVLYPPPVETTIKSYATGPIDRSISAESRGAESSFTERRKESGERQDYGTVTLPISGIFCDNDEDGSDDDDAHMFIAKFPTVLKSIADLSALHSKSV
uniref:Uncharacterized protein n=1 Tax=Glossina pallidipes TaxID=7398 RepID=A0A1A9ZRN9_GLOPL